MTKPTEAVSPSRREHHSSEERADSQRELDTLIARVVTLLKNVRSQAVLREDLSTQILSTEPADLHTLSNGQLEGLRQAVGDTQQLISELPRLVFQATEQVWHLSRQGNLANQRQTVPTRNVRLINTALNRTLEVLGVCKTQLERATAVLSEEGVPETSHPSSKPFFRAVAHILTGTSMVVGPVQGSSSAAKAAPQPRDTASHYISDTDTDATEDSTTVNHQTAEINAQLAQLRQLAKRAATVDALLAEVRRRRNPESSSETQRAEESKFAQPPIQEVIEFQVARATVGGTRVRANTMIQSTHIDTLQQGEMVLILGVVEDGDSVTLTLGGESVTSTTWLQTDRGFVWSGLLTEPEPLSLQTNNFTNSISQSFTDDVSRAFGALDVDRIFTIDDRQIPMETNELLADELQPLVSNMTDARFLLDVQQDIARAMAEGRVLTGENERTLLSLTTDRDRNEAVTIFKNQRRSDADSPWQEVEIFTYNDQGELRSQVIDPEFMFNQSPIAQQGIVIRLSASDARTERSSGFDLEEGDYVLAAVTEDTPGVGDIVRWDITPVNKPADPDPAAVAPPPEREMSQSIETVPGDGTDRPLVTQPSPETAAEVENIPTPEAREAIAARFGFRDELIFTPNPDGSVVVNTPKDQQGYVRAVWRDGEIVEEDTARTRIEELMTDAGIPLDSLDEHRVSYWDSELEAYVLEEPVELFTGQRVRLHIRPSPTGRRLEDSLYFSAGTVEYQDINVTIRMENPFPGLLTSLSNRAITPIRFPGELRDKLRLDQFGVRDQTVYVQLLPFLIEDATPAQQFQLNELFEDANGQPAILDHRERLDSDSYIHSIAISLELRRRLPGALISFTEAIGVGLAETQDVGAEAAFAAIDDRISELHSGQVLNFVTAIDWLLDADFDND